MATSIVPCYFLNGAGGERLNAALGWLSSGIFVLGAIFMIPMAGVVGASLARLCTVFAGWINRTVLLRTVFKDCRWFAGLVTFIPTSSAAGLVFILQWTKARIIMGFGGEVTVYLLASILCVAASYFVYEKILGGMGLPHFKKSEVTV